MWLKNLQKPELRAASPGVAVKSWSSAGYSQSVSDTGVYVDPETALTNATVFACCRVLASTIGTLALESFRKERSGAKTKALRHYSYNLLRSHPNEYQTAFQWISMSAFHVLLTGNAYSYIQRDNGMKAKAIYPLNPARVRVQRMPEGDLVYEYRGADGNSTYFRRDEIIHWTFLTLDGVLGVNPIEYARNTIGKAITQDQYESNLVANSAAPTGVLYFPEKISEEGARKVRESWERMHSGSRNAGRIAILDGGIKWDQVQLSNVDMQWVEQRKLGPIEICKYYGVPPHMIGELDRATFSNIEHQQIQFRQHTILPICTAFEQCTERDLFFAEDRSNFFVKFDLDTLERADIEKRSEAYTKGMQWGWLSRNDIRKQEDLELLPADIGDVYLSPLNMIPAEMASEVAKNSIVKGSQPSADAQNPVDITPKNDNKTAKRAAKRAISSAFARVLTKDQRKREQLSGKPEYSTRLEAFYTEQRSIFSEMLLPGVLTAFELVEEVTPATELRGKALATKAVDRFIDAGLSNSINQNIIDTLSEYLVSEILESEAAAC